ncbi:DUF6660 family protein [Salegentibacter sediminis]|uniref:DUF6660 family protein n=1 Tax=Salegentibacter sediminis TaxID=1930251 RepID=UPI0009BF38B4|nr:DUF6660 family protein [Salegentibacter sediminis]
MKFLTIILSFYFLGLNFLPCDDAVVYEDQENVSVVLDSNQDHRESDGQDVCPPFCICHCCHVHVVQFSTAKFEVIEPAVSTLIVQKGERLGEEIPNTHFQPPRI